jgi:DNA-binding GntR family transcriptional regulator
MGLGDLADAHRTPPGSTLEEIVSSLEEDIVLGELLPRERLVEDALLARFGAKRHVIRQALVQLDRMGLIERVPNRGAQVRAYSPLEVEQLYELRELLETQAALQIRFPIDPAMLCEIEAIQAIHDRSVQDVDYVGIFRSNLAFHKLLFSFCANPFLAQAIDSASQRAHSIRFASLKDAQAREMARNEHHAMIDALKQGDGAMLARLCRMHLPTSKTFYLKVRQGT